MTSVIHPQNVSSLNQAGYDQDFVAWAEATAQLLEQQRFDELDLENLIDEVQGLVRSDKRELKNRFTELLLHLLKWQYQPERRSYPGTDHTWDQNSWARSIDYQRDGIQALLEDSPSLHRLFSESIAPCYAKARKRASRQTGLPIQSFPETCPYQETQILDDEFWPN